MKPIGPLMIEHRLIERMVRLVERERDHIRAAGETDADFLGAAIDFFSAYADRCHHGKEESIPGRRLRIVQAAGAEAVIGGAPAASGGAARGARAGPAHPG